MSTHDLAGDAVPLTDRAQEVFQAAWAEALAHGHGIVLPGHIVLGLLAATSGVAAAIIEELGTEHDTLRTLCMESLPPSGPAGPSRELPYSDTAVQVIEIARRTASRASAPHMSTGHVLLAAVEVMTADNSELSAALGTDLGHLRARVTAVAERAGSSEFGS